jgi:hypothetical protein
MVKTIVSFTTIPSRINNISIILESISKQTIIPDHIVIHCPTKCIRINGETDTEKMLTIVNESPIKDRVIINPCNDYGPITKIFPLIHMKDLVNDDDNIIIIDDDHCYHPKLFETLLTDFYKNNRKTCICVSGLIYPRQVNSPYYISRNGQPTELMEASFSYILQRSFLQQDLDKWVLHDITDMEMVKSNHWINAFLSDDYVISRYMDMKKIQKKVIEQNVHISRQTCFLKDANCNDIDSLCFLGHNLDKYMKTEIELRLKGLVV